MPSYAEPRQEKPNARKGHSLQWKEVIYKTKVPKIKVMPSYAKPRQEKIKCKPIEMHNHVMCLQTIENHPCGCTQIEAKINASNNEAKPNLQRNKISKQNNPVRGK
jgi:hypothetical protein